MLHTQSTNIPLLQNKMEKVYCGGHKKTGFALNLQKNRYTTHKSVFFHFPPPMASHKKILAGARHFYFKVS